MATGRSATFFALIAAVVALGVLGAGAVLDIDSRPALRIGAFAITVVAGLDDLRTRRIRNVLTAPALVLAFAGAPSYPSAALALLVAPIPLLALAILQPGGMGMGDVKLALLLGAVLGRGVIIALLVGMIAALAPALVVAARGGSVRKLAVPFVPFLAFGSVVALFFGDDLLSWWLGLSA